jgi:hypothetical protein
VRQPGYAAIGEENHDACGRDKEKNAEKCNVAALHNAHSGAWL